MCRTRKVSVASVSTSFILSFDDKIIRARSTSELFDVTRSVVPPVVTTRDEIECIKLISRVDSNSFQCCFQEYLSRIVSQRVSSEMKASYFQVNSNIGDDLYASLNLLKFSTRRRFLTGRNMFLFFYELHDFRMFFGLRRECCLRIAYIINIQ